MKGITGRILNSISLLNCKATCDTRIRISTEDELGSEGVGYDIASSNEVREGPRRRRSQACIVGGIERDAISVMSWEGVFREARGGVFQELGRRRGSGLGGQVRSKRLRGPPKAIQTDIEDKAIDRRLDYIEHQTMHFEI